MLIFGNRLQLWQCATWWRRNPYTSAHVLIENILAQRAWRCVAKIECLKALHSSASISVHSASVTVLGLNGKRVRFRMLLSYLRVTHLQRSLSRFTRNTLIEAAILIQVIPTYMYRTNLLACLVAYVYSINIILIQT